MVESCGERLPSQPRLIWREKIRSEGVKNGHGWDKSFQCSVFLNQIGDCLSWVYARPVRRCFFSCLYGVDYLPSIELLNKDSRSYVRGFFLNNYPYNATTWH